MGESEDIVLMALQQIVLKLRSPPFVKNLRILLFPESTPEPMWGIILFIQAQFLQQQKGLCTIFHLLQLASQKSQDFDFSTEIARKVVKAVLKNGLPKGTLLNVNVPAIPPDKIKGIKITKQGHVFFKDRFEKREDPRGRQYYWMTGEIVNPVDASDLDSSVLEDGYVSITPIHYELTNNSFLKSLNDWEFS